MKNINWKHIFMKTTYSFLITLTITLTINGFTCVEAFGAAKALSETPTPQQLNRNKVLHYEISPLIKEINSGLSQVNNLLITRPVSSPNVSERQLNKYIDISRKAIALISEKGLWLKASNADRLNISIGRAEFATKQKQINNKKRFINRQIEKAISYRNTTSKKTRNKKLEQNLASNDELTNQIEAQKENERFDDFWKGNVNPKLSSKEEDDDFWLSVNQKSTHSDTFATNNNKDDFLASSSSNTDKDFWSGGGKPSKNKAHTYKIQSGRNNTQGVISPNGSVLIPYKKWEIKSYRDGLARVQIETKDYHYNACKINQSASSEGYSYQLSIVDEGIVDISGDWVLPSKKKIIGGYGELGGAAGLYLVRIDPNETEESRRRAKARKQKKLRACRIKIKEEFGRLVQRYLSRGHTRGN